MVDGNLISQSSLRISKRESGTTVNLDSDSKCNLKSPEHQKTGLISENVFQFSIDSDNSLKSKIDQLEKLVSYQKELIFQKRQLNELENHNQVFEFEIKPTTRPAPKVDISFQNTNFFKAPVPQNQSPRFDDKNIESRNSSPNMIIVNEEPDMKDECTDFNPIVSFID